MASIPLPALDVKPPNIDPAAGIRNAYAIRGMQQQQQMGSIELQNAQQDQKDRQTISKLMQQYSGDLSKVIPAASTAGVNYKTVAGLQSTNLDIQTKLAGLTKDQLGNFSAVHDNAAGLIQPVLDAPTPEAKDAAYQAGLKKIYANPQMYGITDASQIPAVRPPDETLKTQLALNMGQKEQAAQTMKQREVAAQELAASNRGGPDMAVFNYLVNGGGSAHNGQPPNPPATAVQQQAPPANALAAGPQPQAVPVNPPATGDSQPAQAPVNPPATGNAVQVPPQAQGAQSVVAAPPIVPPQGAPSVPVQPQAGVPAVQPPLSLQDKGQIGFDVAKGMTPEAAYAKLQQMKQEAKPDKTTPVDQQEFEDFMKNPPKGYMGTPTQYAKWKASLSPAAQNIYQNTTPAIDPNDPSVLGVARGDLKLQDVLTNRTPIGYRNAFIAAVKIANPGFKSSDFDIAKDVTKSFTSGSYSQQLNAISTARNHMQTFRDMAASLDNGNIKTFNSIGNSWAEQTGNPAPTNFNLAKDAFMGEVGKSFAGANVTLADRQAVEKSINAASSPKALMEAADTADKLLEGKQKSLKDTYDQGIQSKPNFGNKTTSSIALPSQAASQLQEGHNTTFANGQVWTKRNGQPVQVK